MTRAVVLVVPDEVDADDVARLIAAALSINGYGHNRPSVIDWPDGASNDGSVVMIDDPYQIDGSTP